MENADIEDSNLNVELMLEKQDRMMILNFIIRGEVQVLCDRCLELLFLPVDIDEKYFVKFGPEKKEESAMISKRTIEANPEVIKKLNELSETKPIDPRWEKLRNIKFD